MEEIPILGVIVGKDGAKKDQGSKRMEDANESQEHGEFPWIYKLLPMFYSKLQLRSKTIK